MALSQLRTHLLEAYKKNHLLEAAYRTCSEWLDTKKMPEWVLDSIKELIEQAAWEELNNRFDGWITLGTGGMRGRTIGKVITQAEKNHSHAAVGSRCLNDITIVKATLALFQYVEAYLAAEKAFFQVPSLVIAHDVRFFSKSFCDLVASTWLQCGGKVLTFQGPRSTPQLSFSVRHFEALAGVVITASHNPPHDNGYKIYFKDGAQVTDPHAENILECFNRIQLMDTLPYLTPKASGWAVLPIEAEASYLEAVRECVLCPSYLQSNPPKVVFSPLHGTGAVAGLPAMRQLGVDVVPLAIQCEMDGSFPTLNSPNPENPEALKLAIEQASKVGADAVIVMDPDADRMGIATANANGTFTILSGNQFSSMLAEYRLTHLKQLGILPEKGSPRATLIKSFVTAPMQEKIAQQHGIQCINTLTGFKWIGAKLELYESQLQSKLYEGRGMRLEYRSLKSTTKTHLLLQYSRLCVLGSEESYGYLGNEAIRDKDAHGAAVMACELLAFLKSQGKTATNYLEELYLKYGYHFEASLNLTYEGAAGMQAIQAILNSYRERPPTDLNGVPVQRFTDFGTQTLTDSDGEIIPKQDFYFIQLENGYQYAVRGSGTEPKIKFYLFGSELIQEGESLQAVKERSAARMQQLQQTLEQDARTRAKTR